MNRKRNHPEISKLRSDSAWNKLTPEQRQKLDRWLFEENLSYREAHERAQKELGMTCSWSAIRRIRKQRSKLRVTADLADAQDAARDLENAGADVETLRAANLKLILLRLQDKAMDESEVKDVATLGRLMLESEEREIQRERVALARERFEFKASQAALKALPLVDEMKQEEEERENEHIQRVKIKIFGSELEGME